MTIKDRGFSMLEVVMSLGLLSIVLAGMTNIYISHLKHNTHAALRTGAINAAQQQLDELREQNPQTFPSSGYSTSAIDAGARNYSLVTRFCSTPSFCTTNSRHILVEASYNGQLLYSVETVFTKLR